MSEHSSGQTSAEFTPEVVSALHADDVSAAKNIVILTLGIFLLGTALYTIVALVCAS